MEKKKRGREKLSEKTLEKRNDSAVPGFYIFLTYKIHFYIGMKRKIRNSLYLGAIKKIHSQTF